MAENLLDILDYETIGINTGLSIEKSKRIKKK